MRVFPISTKYAAAVSTIYTIFGRSATITRHWARKSHVIHNYNNIPGPPGVTFPDGISANSCHVTGTQKANCWIRGADKSNAACRSVQKHGYFRAVSARIAQSADFVSSWCHFPKKVGSSAYCWRFLSRPALVRVLRGTKRRVDPRCKHL